MANTANMHENDIMILIAMLWILYAITLLLIIWGVRRVTRSWRQTLYTTALFGPAAGEEDKTNLTTLAARYGAVFQIPTGFFAPKKIVLCDPAAVAHFYVNAPMVYRSLGYVRQATKNLVGRGLMWEDGERHQGHRQALAPLFTECSVRQKYLPVFFEMACKMQSIWMHDLRTRPRGMVVDIQHWMSSVVLDSIGVAGFSHDFESLNGNHHCIVTAAFHALRHAAGPPRSCSLASYVPNLLLRLLPTARNRAIDDFQQLMSRIAGDVLLRNAVKGSTAQDSSFLGLLIQSLAENHVGQFRLSHEGVLTQMNTLLFSGLETTASTLCWILVELARNSTFQDTLRTELHQAGGPLVATNYARISKLPYLHAVIYEALRLHPPMGDTTRVAAIDDVIPLSTPIATKSGETISNIRIAKGCILTVPIAHLNACEALWGPGAHKFDPGRWTWQGDGQGQGQNMSHCQSKSKSDAEFPCDRHLAFGDGPRACLGQEFAFALIKVVLAVVVSNFEVSFAEGGRQKIAEPIMRGRVLFPGGDSEMLMVVRKL